METEWILALETSVTDATLALAGDGRLLAERTFSSTRSQECDLFLPLQKILGDLPEGASLSAIIVGTGPGSYNGARVGIAAAQAIAQVHDCPVAGLCSFEGVQTARQSPLSFAVGDARRGSFFLMPLEDGRATAAPELLSPEDFQSRLAGCHGPKLTFEDPARLPGDFEVEHCRSTADLLLEAWTSRSEEEQKALITTPTEAFYLRPPHITKSKKKLLS